MPPGSTLGSTRAIEYAPDTRWSSCRPCRPTGCWLSPRARRRDQRLACPVAPALLADSVSRSRRATASPVARVGRGGQPSRAELDDPAASLTLVWAKLVHPDPTTDAALAKLEQQRCTCCGSTRTTRSPSWQRRADTSDRRRRSAHAAPVSTRLHYTGRGHRPDRPAAAGSDPGCRPRRYRRRHHGTCRTSRPRRSALHPDPTRVEGHVTSPSRFVLIDGTASL